MNFAFEHRVATGFAVAVSVSIALAVGVCLSLVDSTRRFGWTDHTLVVLYKLKVLDSLIQDARVGMRGYLLTGKDVYLEPYSRSQPAVDHELLALRQLTADNGPQQQRLAKLGTLIATRFEMMKQAVSDLVQGSVDDSPDSSRFELGDPLDGRIRSTITEMESDERRLLASRTQAAATGAQWTAALFLAGTIANLVIFFMLFRTINREAARRLETELSLRQSQERFKGIYDAATVGVALVDPNGNWLDVNPALCAIVGYSREDLLANPSLQLTHPSDLEADMAQARRVLSGEIDSYQIEKRYVHKDSRVLWIAASVSLVRDDHCRPLHFVCLMEDITTRKRAERELNRSEQRYRSLVEASCAIVWTTPASGTFETEQHAWSAFTGQSFEQLSGWGWLAAIHPDDRANTERVWTEAVAGGRNYEVEHRIRRYDGEYLHMMVRAVPILAEDHTIEEWIGVHTDIDAQKRTQAALREAKDVAEEASRLKGEFLANVSHEIRTPLNAILGMTELTLQTELAAEQRENLEIVKSATDSLLTVIGDILDFSKIEAAKVELDWEVFDLRKNVNDVLLMLCVRAHEKGLELASRIRPEVPDQIIGDSARLRQILANLVGNAIKFTERGEVVVDIGLDTEASAENGVLLHFQVTDTGIGVPTEKQKLIFAPFTQADGSTTRRYGGTGLGLAISSHLIDLMGGQVWVESEVGHGSTFHFTAHFALPVDGWAPEIASPEEHLQGMNVLVVDDNAINRQILDEILTHWGMVPTLVDGGLRALVLLEQARSSGMQFSVVLVDAMMPEMDGFTVCERIAADCQLEGTVVLMLTSCDRHRFADRLKNAGVAACLNKPIHQAELKSAILSAIGQKSRAVVHKHHELPRPHRPLTRPLRILLAEDNPFNKRVAVLMLSRQGHEVISACDGIEAVTAVESQSFDLVLMDLQMPHMDGFAATAAIRAAEAGTARHLPIIAMTAHAMKEDRLRCLDAGMDGYVSKPIREVELRKSIDECLGEFGESNRHPHAVAAEPADASADCPMDIAVALERVDGDRGFLAEMVAMFLDESPRLIVRIREAISAGEPAKVVAPAHSLKNWAANLVGAAAFNGAKTVEESGRAGNLAGIGDSVDLLESEIERLRQAVIQFDLQSAAVEPEDISSAIAL